MPQGWWLKGFETSFKEGMKDMGKTDKLETAIDAERVIRIAEHYCHARRKHPHFADALFLSRNSAEDAAMTLAYVRNSIELEKRRDNVSAQMLIECEICEAIHALACGDKAHAVEEIYDAIAVLLRMIDVLEGKQKLGKAGG